MSILETTYWFDVLVPFPQSGDDGLHGLFLVQRYTSQAQNRKLSSRIQRGMFALQMKIHLIAVIPGYPETEWPKILP